MSTSPSTAGRSTPSPTSDAPVGATGTDIPLSQADNFDTQHLIAITSRTGSWSGLFAIQSPGHAAVVVGNKVDSSKVTVSCIFIAAAPTHAGYQGSCVPPGQEASTLAVANDGGPNVGPDSTWYIVWTHVPVGTVYLAFAYGSQQEWQRPLNGASYFTFKGSGPIPGVPLPSVKAYDQNGQQVGEAHIVQ